MCGYAFAVCVCVSGHFCLVQGVDLSSDTRAWLSFSQQAVVRRSTLKFSGFHPKHSKLLCITHCQPHKWNSSNTSHPNVSKGKKITQTSSWKHAKLSSLFNVINHALLFWTKATYKNVSSMVCHNLFMAFLWLYTFKTMWMCCKYLKPWVSNFY